MRSFLAKDFIPVFDFIPHLEPDIFFASQSDSDSFVLWLLFCFDVFLLTVYVLTWLEKRGGKGKSGRETRLRKGNEVKKMVALFRRILSRKFCTAKAALRPYGYTASN